MEIFTTSKITILVSGGKIVNILLPRSTRIDLDEIINSDILLLDDEYTIIDITKKEK